MLHPLAGGFVACLGLDGHLGIRSFVNVKKGVLGRLDVKLGYYRQQNFYRCIKCL